jgi:hypothetical protein
MAAINVTASGPVLVGRAASMADDMTADAVDEVAAVAEEQAVRLMQLYFRYPTPYYWTRVTTAHPAYLTAIVYDQGVVYGPWLEGVGSRNRTTRFKGYRHWRTTRAEVASRVPTITGPVVDQWLDRMRG